MKTPTQILKDAYNLIKNKERWAQGYYQYDANGNYCDIKSGVKFCAVGALNKVTENDHEEEIRDTIHYALCALQRMSEQLFEGEPIQAINDRPEPTYAHCAVLQIYKATIEKFKDREPTYDDIKKE